MSVICVSVLALRLFNYIVVFALPWKRRKRWWSGWWKQTEVGSKLAWFAALAAGHPIPSPLGHTPALRP